MSTNTKETKQPETENDRIQTDEIASPHLNDGSSRSSGQQNDGFIQSSESCLF